MKMSANNVLNKREGNIRNFHKNILENALVEILIKI